MVIPGGLLACQTVLCHAARRCDRFGVPGRGSVDRPVEAEIIVRAHGRDERILVKSFYEAIDFMDDVVTTLAKAQ